MQSECKVSGVLGTELVCPSLGRIGGLTFWATDAIQKPSAAQACALVPSRVAPGGRLMQAVVRQAVAELARGLSTGFVLWSGCPACGSCEPVFHCTCPDCVCQGGGRIRSEPGGLNFFGWCCLVGLGLALLAAGAVAGRWGQIHHDGRFPDRSSSRRSRGVLRDTQ